MGGANDSFTAARSVGPDDTSANDSRTVDPGRDTDPPQGRPTGVGVFPDGVVADRRRALDRREAALRAFIYGNFRPRRREGRREADAHRFLFDWHEPRVFYLALGVLLLSCLDALFTLNLLNHGAAEANIVMASALGHGIDWFLACKISLTGVSLVFLVALARRKFFRSCSVEHLLQLFLAAYLLVIAYEIYIFEYVFNISLVSIF